jgi:hypothetical protein
MIKEGRYREAKWVFQDWVVVEYGLESGSSLYLFLLFIRKSNAWFIGFLCGSNEIKDMKAYSTG